MSQRNFTLLIIAAAITAMAILGFLYFTRVTTAPLPFEPDNTSFISRFNPFNTSSNPPQPNPPEVPPGSEPTIDPETPITKVSLKKISSVPVAGFGTFLKERLKEVPIIPPSETTGQPATVTIKPTAPLTEFAPAVRYVGRAEGLVYQTFLDKLEERKFSSTIIPKVYEAYFGNKTSTVIMRYLKLDDTTIQTFVGTLPKEILGADTTASNEIKGVFLPDNITDLSLSPDKTKAFYLFNQAGSAFGVTVNLTDNKKTQIFDSPFTEWLSTWPRSTTVHLTTKPSWSTPGYMYTLDTVSKSLNSSLISITGLTTLGSPDGKSVLYADNSLALRLYYPATKTSDSIGLRSLPEKCTWSKASDYMYCAVPRFIDGANYPDLWYKGEVSFSDQIWKINALNGLTTLVLDPLEELGGENIDGIKLALDDTEKYLLFVNKKDSYLWQLDLN